MKPCPCCKDVFCCDNPVWYEDLKAENKKLNADITRLLSSNCNCEELGYRGASLPCSSCRELAEREEEYNGQEKEK